MDPFSPETPPDSPLTMQDVVSSPKYRDLSTAKLRVGDPAFPFTLPRLDVSKGAPIANTETVTLESFKGVQPVALIFGSYT
jgi:hypothetical protein